MGTPPSEPYLTFPDRAAPTRSVTVGSRVVLRYRDDDGALTDALGELVSFDDTTALVRTRRGDVSVPRAAIVTGKEVPPAPRRPGPPHRTISPTDLQEVMVAGLPPLESAWQGRWLLRAANRYTGRANSALPLGDPGVPLDQAVQRVSAWYAERDQTPMIQLYGPTEEEAYCGELGAALTEAGWRRMRTTLVMTAATDAVLAATGPASATITPRVDERWVAGATAREQENAATLTAMLDRILDARYVTLGTDRIPDAVGRLALSRGWAGLFGVHVQPDQRRRGHARAVVGALAREAQSAEIRSIYLQVEAANEPAVALYSALGFDVHHEYAYAHP